MTSLASGTDATSFRREFILGCAGCALAAGMTGCTAVNPVPLLDADPDGRVAALGQLAAPGDQIKVRLPEVPEIVLVWRSDQGFGAASIVCTHRGSEVHLNAQSWTLDCPSHGSRFDLEGKVVHGPASKPLRPYKVAVEGDRIRVRPA